MTRHEAMTLASRKAIGWNCPYRVLRCTAINEQQNYTVEQSGSYDSPRGWQLVEVFTPQQKGEDQ